MIGIPVFQNLTSDFSQQIDLGGQLVTLRLVWNIRAEAWFLDFTDEVGGKVTGVKVVPGWPLLNWKKGPLQFEGDILILKDKQDAGEEITYDNFGTGFSLNYVTEEELENWMEDRGF